MVVRIHVMGPARAAGVTGEDELERKSAACVAYLAVEGRQARDRVADLLWPDATLKAARANLRQLARRLRIAVAADVLTSGDPIDVDPAVQIDVQQLLIRAATNDWSRVAEHGGTLLAGMRFDDCPELGDWLALTRSRLVWTMAHALNVEASRVLAEQGEAAAVPLLLRWLELDPLAEEAYRRLMRLHYACGDRGAALGVYEACQATLARHLELEPAEETTALAQEIRGAPRDTSSSFLRRRPQDIPLSLLRPPGLVGRQEAWEKMEAGFLESKLIMVSGPAGIGKTRLVQDFARAQRDYRTRYIACRPGDRTLPYVYFARTWRHELAMDPERLSAIPDWARRELARILPELGEPLPLVDSLQRKRFFDANLEVALGVDPTTVIISDDVHYMDPASHELGIYLGMHFISAKSPLRSVSTFRSDEMDESALRLVQSLFESGLAVHVELTPLTEAELSELLHGLSLPDIAHQAPRLHAHTGGIPFYVVETLKSLCEGGGPTDLPEELTPTDRVRLTIERRLERLHPTALRLLRVAAVLDEPLRVQFARELMEVDSDGLGRAFHELERALLLRSGAVAHDLLRSVILESMPEPERVLLQERVARALHAAGAHPGRVGRHFLAAGRPGEAARYFEQAAQLAQEMLRPEEARELGALAAELRASLVKRFS